MIVLHSFIVLYFDTSNDFSISLTIKKGGGMGIIRQRIRLVTAAMIPLFTVGCGIHPLPEDVTGISTYDIVRQIRCETREALIDTLIVWLTSKRMDATTQAIGYSISDNRGLANIYTLNKLEGRNKHIIDMFSNTGIAYNYTLKMTEINNSGGGIDLSNSFRSSIGTLTAGAGFDRQRENTRTFTITDTFSGLLKNVPSEYCVDHIVSENYIYPIAGKIGMKKVVQDFIELTLFANLGGPAGKIEGPPTMVDALQFRTEVSGSADPLVTFSAVGSGLNVTSTSLRFLASRTDLHEVTVGLALPVPEWSQKTAVLRGTLFGSLLTASGGPSEQIAAEAVNQWLTQRALNSRSVIIYR